MQPRFKIENLAMHNRGTRVVKCYAFAARGAPSLVPQSLGGLSMKIPAQRWYSLAVLSLALALPGLAQLASDTSIVGNVADATGNATPSPEPKSYGSQPEHRRNRHRHF